MCAVEFANKLYSLVRRKQKELINRKKKKEKTRNIKSLSRQKIIMVDYVKLRIKALEINFQKSKEEKKKKKNLQIKCHNIKCL